MSAELVRDLRTIIREASAFAEEGLDIAECDLVVFYETVASVVKFIQRAGRTGRKRAGTVAILFTRGTVDEFRMGALDGKLSRLREVHVVDTGRHGRISMDTLLHEAGVDESAPLVINERFPRAAELAGWLQQARVPASLVPRSELPSILLGKAFGAEVLDVASGRAACVDNTIFSILATLAATRDFKHATRERGDRLVEVPSPVPRDLIENLPRHHGFPLLSGLEDNNPMSQELFALIVSRVFSDFLYTQTWHETPSSSFFMRFLLAFSIEWRTRLGFDISFTWFDEDGTGHRLDPRLPVFGLPLLPLRSNDSND